MEKTFNYLIDIGEQMLISGGEVYKVEECLQRLFAAYGTNRADIFIITSSIVVTVHIDDRTYTQTRRIRETITDYEKLHKLYELSEKICKNLYSEQDIEEALDSVLKTKPYSLKMEFICYAIIAAAFTLFFGGGCMEALISAFTGIIVRGTIIICDRMISNKIFTKYISAFVVTIFAYLALRLEIIGHVDKIIIGNIMTLIPGIGLTTALKDLFMGDSIAGVLRTIEACIVALAIAAGYFTVTILSRGAL